jgi:hypothetical protein
MNHESQRDASKPPAGQKKTYRKPALQVYGSIRQLTQAVGMNSNDDGSGTGQNKTQN